MHKCSVGYRVLALGSLRQRLILSPRIAFSHDCEELLLSVEAIIGTRQRIFDTLVLSNIIRMIPWLLGTHKQQMQVFIKSASGVCRINLSDPDVEVIMRPHEPPDSS